MVKAQCAAKRIPCPRYLIGATARGSLLLNSPARPDEPLTLPDVIFLYSDGDLRAWLQSTESKVPLDLLVIEPRRDQEGLRSSMPEPAKGSNPFFKRRVWDRWGVGDDRISFTSDSEYEDVSDVGESPEDVDVLIDKDGSGITISDDDQATKHIRSLAGAIPKHRIHPRPHLGHQKNITRCSTNPQCHLGRQRP